MLTAGEVKHARSGASVALGVVSGAEVPRRGWRSLRRAASFGLPGLSMSKVNSRLSLHATSSPPIAIGSS